MLDPAMKERHWLRIEEVTGWKFDVESDGFQLRNVMEAPLLKSLEDIEVCVCVCEGRIFICPWGGLFFYTVRFRPFRTFSYLSFLIAIK